MPFRTTRLLAAALATAATTLAACGASDSSTAAGGGAAPACAAACTISTQAPGGPAPAAPGTGCAGPGSGRTDDFRQAVTLVRQPDGLQIGDIAPGSGPQLTTGQTLTVAYTGWLEDGTSFDSSRTAGHGPIQVTLGAHGVIPGFEEALSTMKVGAVRRVVIPPALGYGAGGQGPIPANATLTFDLEVLCAG